MPDFDGIRRSNTEILSEFYRSGTRKLHLWYDTPPNNQRDPKIIRLRQRTNWLSRSRDTYYRERNGTMTVREIQKEIHDERSTDRIHYGFGNPDNPRILVVTEAPSPSHFEVPWYDQEDELSPTEYRNRYHTGEGAEALLTSGNWLLYPQFLNRVLSPFGISGQTIFDETFEISLVGTPVPEGVNKQSWLKNQMREYWGEITRRQIAALNPEVLITSGAFAKDYLPGPEGYVPPSSNVTDPETWRPRQTERFPVFPIVHWLVLQRPNNENQRRYWMSLGALISWLSSEVY